MQTDRFACFELAARYPNHTLVRGYGGNQQPCCLVVHRPVIIKAIDLVRGNTTIDLYLIRPVNNPCRLLIKEDNTGLG